MATKKKKKSLRERMAAKKKQLESRGEGKYDIEYLSDEGTYRVRLLPLVDEEGDFVFEVTSFYLGNDIRSVYSPDTFGEPCAIMEAYNELKKSDDEEDKELAEKMSPRKTYLTPVLFYKDLKGKKVDEEKSGKLLKISKTVFNQMIDLYLDEDEWGDITDPKKGYDIKITRTGKGKNDTKYDAKPCKNTSIPKKYKKPVDLEEMIKKVVSSYDETVDYRDQFLGLDEDSEPEKKKKKKSKGKKTSSKRSKTKKKGKKKKGDI